jgi:pullulanase
MGIHDIETMNAVSAALHEIDPTLFIYGEGWTAGDSPLPENRRALKKHTHRMDGVAAFSDDIRDAIKGHVFTHDDPGFASGKPGLKESIKFGVVASTEHPQIRYDSVNYSNGPWAGSPAQTMTYVSCHDNHTLWDRLEISRPDASEDERIRMHKLALATVLTSQGVAFLHAGAELLRTKQGVENSFESPDAINRIDWSRKGSYADVYDYVHGLIQLRKRHPAFRMTSTEQIRQHLNFLEGDDELLVAYTLSDHANGDDWERILVILNGNRTERPLELPAGQWTVVLDEEGIDENGRGEREGEVTVPASSAMVLVSSTQEES